MNIKRAHALRKRHAETIWNDSKTKKLFQSEIESESQSAQLYHIIYASLVASTSASQVRHKYAVLSCFIIELSRLLW